MGKISMGSVPFSDYVPFVSSIGGVVRLLDVLDETSLDKRSGSTAIIAKNRFRVDHESSRLSRLGRTLVTLIPFLNLITLPYDFVICRVNYRKFKEGLETWAAQPSPTYENRREAVRRILECCGNKNKGLDLQGLNLTTLPPELGSLGWLEGLNLSHNQIIRIPDELTQLVRLQEVDLSGNRLNHIPAGFFDIESLRVFRAPHNKLSEVPYQFHERFRNLEVLDLSYNTLSGSLTFYGNLQKLKALNLANNRLTNVDIQFPNFSYSDYNIFGPKESHFCIRRADLERRSDVSNSVLRSLSAGSYKECLLELTELNLSGNQFAVEPTLIAAYAYIGGKAQRFFRGTKLERLFLGEKENAVLKEDTRKEYANVIKVFSKEEALRRESLLRSGYEPFGYEPLGEGELRLEVDVYSLQYEGGRKKNTSLEIQCDVKEE